MHIMAVSGLHAGVISMFVFSVLFFLRGRLLVLRVIISVGVLWCFAFITGLSPSVERAALMFTFLHTGNTHDLLILQIDITFFIIALFANLFWSMKVK
ncbi:MAG: ComEC/Rec2 family competence protein, partial [Acidobacteria bacterium]|nr:ComEC/Rec2 family competence protein [Acidobacteriota bacterium]